MNYQETLDYLFSRLPVFQNIGARAFKPGLHTTIELCRSLGNPQDKYPCIHVGGTNGKGSTSHMLAAVMQAAGYKVGLYTSPHLKSFTERIKVNGEEIEQKYIVDFTEQNISNIDRLNPSFFEMTVAMAFSYFAKREVDIAIIEVGMGGRLDSTNIITPLVSVITNVSYDHMQFLGDTLEKIAVEKAGIIKKQRPIVISEYQDEIYQIFETIAEQLNSPLIFGSKQFELENIKAKDEKISLTVRKSRSQQILFENLNLDLTGSYQVKNICGVLAALSCINESGFQVEQDAVYEGLKNVKAMTGLKGRWQKLNSKPDVFCDTAHNTAGLKEALTQFINVSRGRMRFVIGFVGDKDITTMLTLFPAEGQFYFTQPSNMRALPAPELQTLASEFGLSGKYFSNVNEALHAAVLDSDEADSIYVGGSTFVVADLDQL